MMTDEGDQMRALQISIEENDLKKFLSFQLSILEI
jgi:hypothetical protein